MTNGPDETAPKILVVGGSGMFGRRLVRHLAKASDYQIILTSRTASKAQALADDIATEYPDSDIQGIGFDRDFMRPDELTNISADIIVDCSGPFQAEGYELAEAALSAGSHFVDIADARSYLEGAVPHLDPIATKNGLIALSGTSSTPAMSANVVDELAKNWQDIRDIELAITPGGKSEVGRSVLEALLSYAGQPISAWIGGKPATATGLINSKIIDIPRLGRRRIAPVETYDALYLGKKYNVSGNVTFYAGLEAAIEQWSTIFLAHLCKFKIIKSLVP